MDKFKSEEIDKLFVKILPTSGGIVLIFSLLSGFFIPILWKVPALWITHALFSLAAAYLVNLLIMVGIILYWKYCRK